MQEDLIFPMHPSQFDVYADQLLDTKSPHYNIGGYIKLKGVLSKDLFYKAVASGAKTFDAFRMRFDLTNPEPGILLDNTCGELQMSDADFSNEHDPTQRAMEWMQERFNSPFSFEKNSLLYEHFLIKISENEHWFFGKYHHLITDGYGFVVWVQYLSQKYRLLLASDLTPLLFSSYVDEAKKASAYKDSQNCEDDRNYWLDKISAKPKKFLPKKFDNLSLKKSETYFLQVSQQQRDLLDKIEEATKIRLHHLTIAALHIYYGQTSGESEFFFGIPVHKRSSREARNIVGMFSGIIPYKNIYKKDITLTDLLKEIIQAQKEDYKHQYFPLGDLARSLKVKPQDGYLFDVVINYKPLNFEISFGEQIQATTCELSNEFLKYPLQLCWQDYGKQQPLQLQIDYGSDYFERKEIELLAQRFLYILSQFPTKFDKPVGDFKILPTGEKEMVLKFSTGENKVFPHKNIVTLFEEQVSATPHATAIVFGNEGLTYDELNRKANQLGHYLRIKGIKEETVVPLCIERCLEMSVAIMGILKAGGAYVPIDPDYPGDRINYMLHDSRASIILCNNKSREALSTDAKYEFISLDGDWEIIKTQPDYNVSNQLTPVNIAYVIYTSGSTGKPKGVMNQHDGIANRLNWAQDYFKLTPDDAVLQKTSFSFDVSVWELIWPLLTGAKLVFAKPGGQKDNSYLKTIIDEHKITMVHFVPSMFGVFLPDVNPGDCKSLKKVLCSGEALSASHANLFKQKLPQAELHNLYGPTEAAIDVTCWTMDNRDSSEIRLVPIGKPVANTKIYILDEKSRLLPAGVPGEIHIGGVQVARGYVNKPDLTAQKFIENHLEPKQKSFLYKTGDLGRWLVDGNIEYIGRIDDQVKVRGFRIELGEIESVLQKCEFVQQAVVVTRPGVDGNMQLVGYIIPEGSFNKDHIASFLKSR
ncbi:MAG: amino acid adenylation domain-containing protein, partial [Ginsengibacter sp.]